MHTTHPTSQQPGSLNSNSGLNGINMNSGPPGGSAPQRPKNNVPQPDSGSPQPAQQREQRAAYPWTAHRLVLPPPIVLNRPGIVPPTSPSPSPFPRYGHALPSTPTANGDLYIFGGLVRESARNDLYLFSTRDQSATLLQTTGDSPSPRVGHASALVSNVLIVWGGDTKTDPKSKPTDKQDDSLYLLNHGMIIDLSLRSICNSVYSLWRLEMDQSHRPWARPRWPLRPRSHHGRLQIHGLWWPSGRGIFK
jgi:hypothetical protein